MSDKTDKIRFYFDEHMPRIVQKALIEQRYDVIMAVDVGMTGKDGDSEHLPYATTHQLVLFTRDRPFAGRTAQHTDHTGLICWTGHDDDFSGMIRQLLTFVSHHTAIDCFGQVFWIKDNQAGL
ncbi:MAG: DUF5615 family PIN-like protein [Phototrophicales bacterium]|nr:DUF5615 family PIN-like protein [Phototrophicales bacterium]